MEVFTKINIDLAKRKFPEQIHAMQLDANTRVVVVSLYDSGMPWDVPDGVSPSVAFRKSDGKGGWYSELPDEAAACTVDGNEVTVTLAPEVLTCAGKTEVAIVLQDSETLDQIASFPFDVIVTPNPAAGEDISNNYFEYKTMADVNEALIGFREEIRAFGVEIGEFSGSLRPTRYSLSASGAQTEGWNSIRDLPVGRIYRIPSGNHPPEGFGLPYKGAKQSTLVVIGAGDTAWRTLYICAVRDGGIWFAYDDPSATGDVVWQTLNAGDIIVTDTGSEVAPLELSKYGVKSGSVVRFLPGASYVVAPFDLTGAEHVQMHLNGATVKCAGDHFLRADGCDHLKIRGGTVLGGTVADADGAFHGIELKDCKNAAVEQVVFRAMGAADMKNAMGLHLLGDCTGFSVDRCTFRDITAGQIGADGFIHAFGLVVNLKDDDYSRTGRVSGCMFRDIAALDASNADGSEKKGDGDGIFIQRHPYLDGEQLMGIDQDILIEGCSFEGCKKRGVKSAAYGTHIRDCRFEGAFWLAPVEFQFGHGSVRDCHIVNTSDYNGSVTCGIAVGDGGVTVEDSYISCPYGYTYHPGIRLKSRHDVCVYGPEAAWDPCVFRRCRLDGVNYGICSFQSSAASQPYTLSELVVEDCQIGRMNRDYGVFFDGNLIGAIGAVKVVGLRFEHGGSYDEVLAWFRETYGEDHVYWFKAPVGIRAQVTDSFHVYSRHWRGAGVERPFPVVRDTKVLYVGGEDDTVRYLEHRGFGSRACGHGAPADPVLYHSRVGDEYTDLDTGDMYVCVEAGTDSNVGTWTAVGAAVSPEDIQKAVNEYLEENPPSGGSASGEDGGYYKPSITQTDAGKATFNWQASQSDMPAVAAQTVTLPAGPQGPQGEKGDTGAIGPQGPQGPAGSDASVTAANIAAALGHEPADKAKVEVLGARMDALTALGEGSTTGDAELVDARVDIEGKVWANVGGHLRGITGKIVDACCDKVIVEGDNYNLLKTSEVELSARLQNDVEGTISSTATNAVTGWIPVTYGKYYALSTLHRDAGRTTGRNHFPRVQLQLSDGTVKLYATQEYPNTASSDTKILGVDHENAVAMRLQFQVKDASGTAQDISTADLLKAYAPMLVEGNTAEEAQSNAVTFEYMDGDAEAPGEVGYVLKADPAKADQEDLDSLKSRVDTFTSLDTSMLYEAQKRIASDWRIPFIDVFHKLGLGSNHVIPNSYDVWGGTGNDLTQKAVMMSDGVHPSMGDGVTMMYAQTIVPQLRAVPPLYSQDSESDDWTGKTILWMGTSIPAGSDSALGVEGIGTTYPAITASKLGATCTNIAKGSSCVRINASAGDHSGFKYAHLIRALSRTKAEADIIQANWDSIMANVVDAASTISDSDLEIMKAHSFETLLLPYLDGTYAMPDLFVLDHGHNDIRPRGVDGLQDSLVQPTVENIENGKLAEDTYMIADNYANLKAALNNDLSRVGDIESFAASLNRNCLIGAINFLITLIYSYNPRARIVIVSDYN